MLTLSKRRWTKPLGLTNFHPIFNKTMKINGLLNIIAVDHKLLQGLFSCPFYKKKSCFQWWKPHNSVNNKKITNHINLLVLYFFFAYANSACSLVSILALTCCSLQDVFSSRVSWDQRIECTCSCSVRRQKASRQCAFACDLLDW